MSHRFMKPSFARQFFPNPTVRSNTDLYFLSSISASGHRRTVSEARKMEWDKSPCVLRLPVELRLLYMLRWPSTSEYHGLLLRKTRPVITASFQSGV